MAYYRIIRRGNAVFHEIEALDLRSIAGSRFALAKSLWPLAFGLWSGEPPKPRGFFYSQTSINQHFTKQHVVLNRFVFQNNKSQVVDIQGDILTFVVLLLILYKSIYINILVGGRSIHPPKSQTPVKQEGFTKKNPKTTFCLASCLYSAFYNLWFYCCYVFITT